MSENATGLESFGARLRRRKLVQWGAAYMAGGWLLLQVLAFLGDTFALPVIVARVATALLGVGLIAVLVLAWYHGERGEQRVTGMELALFAVLAVLAGAAVAMLGRGSGPEAASAQPSAPVAQASLVVLPFADLSPGGDQEYFSDGITEEILNALVRVPGLRVPGRTTSFSFKGTNLGIAEIGRQLSVAHVLEGSVRKDGDRLRITAQLVDARTDTHLWSETYDRQLADVFALQEEISRAIVDALQVRLVGRQKTALVKRPTEDLEAYNLYLQGRAFFNRRGDNVRTAITYFERAVARDPEFARGWAALAESHAVLPVNGDASPTEALRAVQEYAAKALALDSTIAEAHASLGNIYTLGANFEAAEPAFEKALTLDPNNLRSRHWHCNYLRTVGRIEEALSECERALRLDPRDANARAVLGGVLLALRRYGDAEAELRRSLELEPGLLHASYHLIKVLVAAGRATEAADQARLLLELSRRGPAVNLSMAGFAFAAAGDSTRTRELLREIESRAALGEVVSATNRARLHLALGERDRALTLLGTGDGAGFFFDPEWDPVRADPRFQRILRRLGVEP